jgi:ribonuclease P/MRP protein subunit POP5
VIKREKRRYLALQVETIQPFHERAVLNAVNEAILRLFGETGASKTNLRMIKSVPEQNQLIIRCSHLMLEQTKAAITSITKINQTETAIHILAVSGTIKALTKKMQ